MAEQNNATCAICGKRYRVCNSCLEQKTFQPWRKVVDTSECFKIYSALHGYTITGDKDAAREELQQCDLKHKDTFIPKIRADIDEILSTPQRNNKTLSKPKKNADAYKAEAHFNKNVNIADTQDTAKE